jgi:hypothetical protein
MLVGHQEGEQWVPSAAARGAGLGHFLGGRWRASCVFERKVTQGVRMTDNLEFGGTTSLLP